MPWKHEVSFELGAGPRPSDGETRPGGVLPPGHAPGLCQGLCSSCQRVTRVMAAWEDGGASPAPLGEGTVISLGWRDVVAGINAGGMQQAICVPWLAPGTSLACSYPTVWGVLWALGHAAFLLPPVKKIVKKPSWFFFLAWLEFHKLRLFQPRTWQLC